MVQCNLGRLRSASFVCSWKSKWRDSPQRSREALVSGDGRTQYPSLLSIAVYFRTHPLRSCKPAFGVHLVYVEFLCLKLGLEISASKCLREDF